MTGDALRAALRRQRRAARVGFDWSRSTRHERMLWAKLAEEIKELRAVKRSPARATEELGDLLFMVVNVARYLGLDPVVALRGANRKFERRFAYIMRQARKLPPKGSRHRLAAMEKLWVEAKRRERR